MDKKDAKALVKKLTLSAYVVGQHSNNTESLMFKSEEKKALKLGDEIVHHLTSHSSRAAGACAHCWRFSEIKRHTCIIEACRNYPPSA